MRIYNDIIVTNPKHYANPIRTFRTDSTIKFSSTGISFSSGGHRYFIEHSKVISIEPVIN
jgi:hypothetical protein